MKIVIALAFVIIIGSLASALFFLLNKKSDPRNMARALTIRIGISVLLFLTLLVAHYFGLINSTGLR